MPQPAPYRITFLSPGAEGEAAALVERVFLAQVAPHFSAEGVAEFLRYVPAPALAERLAADNFMLVAEGPRGLAGVVEADASRGHIVWFFVDAGAQGLGLGRELMARAVAELRQRRPDLVKVTVNSSPNSVGVYRSLGFEPSSPEQEHNGIRFTPMELALA